METPPRRRLMFLCAGIATAMIAILVAALAVPRHGPALRTDAATSGQKGAEPAAPEPLAAPAAPAPAGLMSATGSTGASTQNPGSFDLDNPNAGAVPWNGLAPGAGDGAATTGLGFADRRISAAPTPAAGVPIDPVVAGDRTEGPSSNPGP